MNEITERMANLVGSHNRGHPDFYRIVRDMQSLSFIPGRALLSSDSPQGLWNVVFEDEGLAGYFYACDRSQPSREENIPNRILDAMLIYNVSALKNPEEERLVAVEWSRDGLQAVLYLDGTAQALFDFKAREGYCRTNFPNFLSEQGDTWRKSSHAWSDAVFEKFEAALYA
jgi:hypothetical protein